MTQHDPLEFAAALGAKLATRERHVCAFLGAGVSRACKLPDVAALQTEVQESLEGADRETFRRLIDGRNLEQVLSRLRRIAGLVTGADTVDMLTATKASDLDTAICRAIVRALDVGQADLAPVRDLAAWAARADYRLPLELFTVNYDLLLETALEDTGVPYFDGFVGNLRARFRTELVEALPDAGTEHVPSLFVRLWKLHGSVNWVRDEKHGIVRLGQPVHEDRAAAIYPSDAKYEESRRVPFVVLQDRLRRALHQPETLMLVAGYSFGDAHLNEMLFDAATRRERSEFVVFCHSDIPHELADSAPRMPNVQVVGGHEAILGGLRGDWKAPEDAVPNLWEGEHLALTDFVHLAAYLARNSARETEPLSQAGVAADADGA